MLTVAAVLMACAAAAPLAAEPAGPELLQRPDALAAHLQKHRPELREGAARVAAARAELGQSSVWFQNPSVQAAVGGWPLGNTNPVGLRLDQVLNASVGVSATVDVLKKGPRIRAAQLALAGEQEARVAQLVDLMADARATLGDVLFATARQRVLEEGLRTAQALADAEERRVERGVSAGLNADRARLEVERLGAEVAQARAEVEQMAGACAVALGTRCDVSGADGLAVLARWKAQGAGQGSAQVQAWRLAAQSQREAAAGEARAILPDPTVSLGYTLDRFIISGNNPSVLMAGISVPIPLFDRGQHREAAARARGAELNARADGLEQQRSRALDALRQQESALVAALGGLETDAVPRARRLADAMQAAAERGQVPLTDQLLARRALTDTLLQRAQLHRALFMVRNERARLDGADTETARQRVGS